MALVVVPVLELFKFNICIVKSENIVTLVTIGYIVGFIVGMHIEYCLWAQVVVLLMWLDILDYIVLFRTGYAGFVFG